LWVQMYAYLLDAPNLLGHQFVKSFSKCAGPFSISSRPQRCLMVPLFKKIVSSQSSTTSCMI